MKPSRAMITGEISWAFLALTLAWSGSGIFPFEDSYLHGVLDQRNYDEAWSIVAGFPAVALMYFSMREFIAHAYPSENPLHRWYNSDVRRSAKIRGRMSLALAFSFVYIVYVMLQVEAHPSAITPIAIGGAVMCLWFWIENRRVQRECKKHNNAYPAAAAN